MAARSEDHLLLSRNAVVTRMLSELEDGARSHVWVPCHGRDSGSERVLFSDNVGKINRKGKQQRRVLLVTNKGVYNLVPASLACRRRITLQRVEKLILSRFSDEFVVRVPTEYDYRFTSPQRLEAVQLIQESRSALSGYPPKVEYVDESSLADWCITKPVARRLRAKGELPAAAAGGGGGGGASSSSSHDLGTIKERREGARDDEEEEEEEEDEDAPTPLGQGSPTEGESRMRSKTIGWARKETSVTLDDFDLLKVIGRGSFGKVMQVRKKDTGEVLAMKILVKSAIFQRNQVEHTVAERAILESIEHPFLIQLRFAFQTPTKLYLVLPYLTGGELFFHLRKMKRFKEDLARFYVAEIALGLGHLHSLGVVYRDLKPENILLDSEGHVCLTDFGLAKTLSRPGENATTFCGTPEYLAPEVIRGQGHDKEVDWWSLGILLFEMLTGLPPFYSKNTQLMYDRIDRARIVFPGFMSDDAKDFLSRILDRNPTSRLGHGIEDVEEIKRHPFFASVDWEGLMNRELTPPFRPNVSAEDDTGNFDREFTSEPVVDTFVPDSALGGGGGAKFEGFTYVGGGPMGGGGEAVDGEDREDEDEV